MAKPDPAFALFVGPAGVSMEMRVPPERALTLVLEATEQIRFEIFKRRLGAVGIEQPSPEQTAIVNGSKQ